MKTFEIKIVEKKSNTIVADLCEVKASDIVDAKRMFSAGGLAAGFRYAVFAV